MDSGHSDGYAKTERAVSGEAKSQDEVEAKSQDEVETKVGRDPRRLGGTLLRRGDELGRFKLGDVLGEGGMGAVVSAYDSTLDRKVAIKVLRPGALLDVDDDEARSRLLREARAMARVKHPNVITVHEVGEDRGQVFIAMEYVEGGTLREWMSSKRTWRETVEMFLPIAEGLAAAHNANLVHRDVKPENVLLSTDGIPIVTDFGLASASAVVREVALDKHNALNVTLTQTGAVMGTPAYMAPEQHEGEEADARADQFAFCVMLWEALYGERPFAGSTFAEVRENVIKGEISMPSSGDVGVPAALDRAMQKGLSPDPATRFESMSDLLNAIDLGRILRRSNMSANLVTLPGKSTETNKRPILLAIGGGVAVLLAVVIAGFALSNDDDRRSDLCRGFETRLTGVWDAETKRVIRDAFIAVDPGGRSFARLEPVLDRYAGRWVLLRRASCEATLVRGELPNTVYDQQLDCFDRRLNDLRKVTARLELVDGATMAKAVDAALSLQSVDRCAAVR